MDIWKQQGTESGDLKSIPMEFIQVLIHQHAKTLVALQDLEREVVSLKSSSSNQNQQHPVLLRCDSSRVYNNNGVNYSIVNDFKIDSGFKSGKSEEDELYSLLSQIQFKVESLSNKKLNKTEVQLGALDSVLGNSDFDFKKFKQIDKDILRDVLKCQDIIEIKRQLLFTLSKLKNCEESSSCVASLKCENALLRAKLNELKSEEVLKLRNKSGLDKNVVKSLSSIGSVSKSLIPIPIARNKNKNKKIYHNNNNNNFWQQWFG